jgi:DNA-binding response OmpR family regulator
VLIIEDDRAIAELERDYLETGGFGVDLAFDGAQGLRQTGEAAYDLVLLDVMLPGRSGFEICRSLRAKSEVPILLVSARTADIDKIRGLGLGADDYITKPFSPAELVARVKAHLARYERLRLGREGSDDRAAPITAGSLVLERESMRVTAAGREVALTAREFDVLALLASRPDRVFSREEIFDRIWGGDALSDPSTVTVHIRRIREKIEADPSHPRIIETVWGVGYRVRG